MVETIGATLLFTVLVRRGILKTACA